MGSRKRPKPNPEKGQADETPAASQASRDASSDDSVRRSPQRDQLSANQTSHPETPTASISGDSANTLRSTRSWYGGTWRRPSKAIPVTQVDRESIAASSPRSSSLADISTSDSRGTPDDKKLLMPSAPSILMTRNMDTSRKSLLAAATTSNLSVSSGKSPNTKDDTYAIASHRGDRPLGKAFPQASSGSSSSDPSKSVPGSGAGSLGQDAAETSSLPRPGTIGKIQSSGALTGDSAGHGASNEHGDASRPGNNADDVVASYHSTGANMTSWLHWFPKSAPTVALNPPSPSKLEESDSTNRSVSARASKTGGGNQQVKKPTSAVKSSVEAGHHPPATVKHNSERVDTSAPAIESKSVRSTGSEQESRPWFSLWPTHPDSSVKATGREISSTQTMKTASYPAASDTSGKAAALGDKPTFAAAADKLGSKPNEQSRQSSAWTFWTKERDSTTSTNDTGNSSQGKLAVAGSPSESRPEAASVDVSDETTAGAIRPAKRGRPVSLETTEESPLRTDPSYSTPKMTPSHSPAPAKTKLTGPSVKQQLQKSLPANLLLPSFKNTYHLLESPSILQQIARLLHYHKQSPAQHVHLIRQPQRIKRALAIGIHGYFPAPLLRSVLGQPTGTSIRFATSAAEAIRKWTANQGYDCEIEKVALEGEGRIGERVDILWKLVLNWIDRIQKADFVLFACHSQGVPVTMILVAKLIEFGCLSSARVGVCAMAGVNLGPFPEYKSRLFSGSAGELFEFANPASAVAQRYVDALRIAVQHGVRVVYVGSIDDQLVSLESSTFSTVNHPYIYRAVFVDGRVHAPDFITHLVGFALKLRNLGFSDHGLIRELSAPLAGSLYSGEGHSRLYEDDIAYSLAVEHALETTSVGDVALQVQKYEVPAASNPFILPWSMRGLLEEDYVRTELSKEMTELLQQFDAWKPNSKVLKDVKFRLEAVKSKL